MAVRELTSSRNISYNEGQPTGIREFHCHPYATEQEVVALIGVSGGLPGKMFDWPSSTLEVFPVQGSDLRVFDHSIRRDPNVTQAWIVTVTYRQRGYRASVSTNFQMWPNQPGAATKRLDYLAKYEDAWRQWERTIEIEFNVRLLDENQVPRYAPFTPESDIGGSKIDAAGYPTSILRYTLKLTIDLLDDTAPDFPPSLIGSRNSKRFLGVDRGMLLFIGVNSVELPNGFFNASYNFEVDSFFHLKQVPKRQANGYVVLDLPANADDVTATGQAKIVSYIQPFPRVADFYTISPRFAFIR
jgi:hypothetical protein